MPGVSPLNVFEINQLTPPFILYSKVPLPDAFTTMVPEGIVQVGCVTAGAVIVGPPETGLITTGLEA